METFITALTSTASGAQSLSLTNLWAAIDDVAPLVIVLVLFSLARRVINKNLSAAAKGKSGRI